MGKRKAKNARRRAHDVNPTTTSASSATLCNARLSRPKKQQKVQQLRGHEDVDMDMATLSFDDAFSTGVAFQQLQCYDGAIAAFKRAIACQNTHINAFTCLADVYAAAGQIDEALTWYMKASELEDGKDDASVWFRLGLAYTAVDQQLKATKAYRKAMKIHARALKKVDDVDEEGQKERRSAYSVTLAALAGAYGALGDLDAAVNVFQEAVATLPDAANLHYNLANMRMARSVSAGDDSFDPEVVQCLERAIMLDPHMRDFVDDLAAYLDQHKQQLDRVCTLKELSQGLTAAETAAASDNDDDVSASSDAEEDCENGDEKRMDDTS